MKTTFIMGTFLFVCLSCEDDKKSPPELTELGKFTITEKEEYPLKPLPAEATSPDKFSDVDCASFLATHFPDDSVKISLIKSLLNDPETRLSRNNKIFLDNFLKEIALPREHTKLTIEQCIFPIFMGNEGIPGIFSFPQHTYINNKVIDISPETKLFSAVKLREVETTDHFQQLIYYPEILDSLYSANPGPEIFFYTPQSKGTASIEHLGIYEDECITYYKYGFRNEMNNSNQSSLMGSKYPIDLEYGNVPNIDELARVQLDLNCSDCPNSHHLMKTYARFKGSDIYFVYTDSDDHLSSPPSRGIIYLRKNKELAFLWYKDLDLLGCGCI